MCEPSDNARMDVVSCVDIKNLLLYFAKNTYRAKDADSVVRCACLKGNIRYITSNFHFHRIMKLWRNALNWWGLIMHYSLSITPMVIYVLNIPMNWSCWSMRMPTIPVAGWIIQLIPFMKACMIAKNWGIFSIELEALGNDWWRKDYLIVIKFYLGAEPDFLSQSFYTAENIYAVQRHYLEVQKS